MRGAAAVIAGLIVLTLLSFLIERTVGTALMQALGLTKEAVPVRLFVVAQTLLCMVAAGYVCARLARRAGTKHAVVMGCIQFALTLYVMVALPGYGSIWISLIGVLLLVPAAWLGAWLRERKRTPLA
jgi:MFS family permease